MLRLLNIRNFVIVDHMEVEFDNGFTVLTGETGAGKSILIDALSLALGERSDAAQVRNGSKCAEISAEFDIRNYPELQEWLQENDLEGKEDERNVCLVRRVIEAGGRSRSFINGCMTTLQQLRILGRKLVDIHGQHEHQSLLRSEEQRDLLDAFAGNYKLAKDVAISFYHWQDLKERRIAWEKNTASFKEEREEVEFKSREILALNFSLDEWESLTDDHRRLSHSASLLAAVHKCVEILSERDHSSLSQINLAISHLKGLVQYDNELKNIFDMLDSVQIQLQEAVYELEHYKQGLELDPKLLQEMEDRLSVVHAISRKYRITPDKLPDLLEILTQKLDELNQIGDGKELIKEEEIAKDIYMNLAKELSVVRDSASKILAQKVTAAMQTLAMEGGRFFVSHVPLDEGNAHGMEKIQFKVSTHKGMSLYPLAKIVSGGELSRISLAIQVVTSKVGVVPTLIFDEIDVGIGGRVAEIVGELLKKLGIERQVMCVTHLAQVASAGNQQWQVSKFGDPDNGNNILSHVTVLKDEERVEEIARMLGGVKITETTRKHAAEMLLGNKS
ncbi:MAG: DNA repair protein RecN [Nitrosomonadaceae bacterium]|nr:DNA repair protein RecN [Nitrosomonadaceae bacterium]|tara:strand:- start:550 stop:2232 length:1683 start_codon:yes stop_codon:yes gene_type:complete